MKWQHLLTEDLKKDREDLYAGRLHQPCDEDCLEGCDGEHVFELPVVCPEVFKINSTCCPACGNPAEFDIYGLTIICDYCHGIFVRRNNDR